MYQCQLVEDGFSYVGKRSRVCFIFLGGDKWFVRGWQVMIEVMCGCGRMLTS